MILSKFRRRRMEMRLIQTFRTKRAILLIMVVTIVLPNIPVVIAQMTVDSWNPLFEGIDQAKGWHNGIQNVNCLRIDVQNPKIRFFTTPSSGGEPRETISSNASQFLTTYDMAVAVNASYFYPFDSNNPHVVEPKGLEGLCISDGDLVSTWDGKATMAFTAGSTPTMLTSNPADYSNIHTAVAGRQILVQDGQRYTSDTNSAHPRTAMGYSQDKKYYYMMTIDGRQFYGLTWVDGATLLDTADWLLEFGAYDGVNFDGGGSTTMVKTDGNGGSDWINQPMGGVPGLFGIPTSGERYVGNHLGVYIVPEPSAPTVHYIFEETAPGIWEVSAEVTGEETSGLSAYEIWVDADPTTVSYTENTLGTDMPVGFLSGTLVQGDVGGSFNAGNYQGSGDAIQGIGMVAVYEEGSNPGVTPLVDLDPQALLGILSTPVGLGAGDFRGGVVGLLNLTGDGFFDANSLIPTLEVIPLPLLLGDANCDGIVSAGDYASVQSNFGDTGDLGIPGDANGDGVVSAGDYAAVQANFGNVTPTRVTPEPSTMILLGTGVLGLVKRRWTKR
jgi:hypothetical protein